MMQFASIVKLMYGKYRLSIVILSVSVVLSACATYYQQSISFQEDFSKGDLQQAQAFLEHHKKAAEKKDRLLYFLDRGVVEQMLGNFEESNHYFEQAYIFAEDYRKNFTADIVGMTVNPMLKTYPGEDFELILVHFYKTMNYLQMHQLDEAMVEVKRINIKLNKLDDKYRGKINRYQEDAFAHVLMGIIYEAKGDLNNAFIAYRNGFEVYQNRYDTLFHTDVPLQLKKDLVRTAALNGFRNEQKQYESEFGFNHIAKTASKSDVIFFWLNGLGPVKSELSINLTAVKGEGGVVTFSNDDEGFSIPYIDFGSNNGSADLSDVKMVRMALPKYLKREPLITEAYLEAEGESYQLQKAEDVTAIAISTLQDRMLREIAQSVGRLAIKQASEEALRQQNEDLGAILSVINASTEKADTRNWQTLPSSISYSRIAMDKDSMQINLVTKGSQIPTNTMSFNVKSKPNETVFKMFHSLESTAPMNQ